MRKILLIAQDTFEEARRRKIVLVALLMVGAFLILYGIGLYFLHKEIATAGRLPPSVTALVISEVMVLGLWAASFISSLLGIFLASGTIRNDVEHGYVHVLLARPLSRIHLIVGRWLGLSIMLAALTALVAGVMLAIAHFVAGYTPPRPALVIVFLAIQPILLISISVMGSTFLPAIANGIAVFVLFMIAMVAGTVEQIGHLVNQDTLVVAAQIISLLVPTDIPWRQAALYAQPDILSSLQLAGPFSVLSAPTPWMDLYMGLYCALCLSIACLVFSFQDL